MMDFRSALRCVLLIGLVPFGAEAAAPQTKTAPAPQTVPNVQAPSATVRDRAVAIAPRTDRIRSVSYGADIAIERFTVSETSFVFDSPDAVEQVRVSCRLKNLGRTDSGPVELTLTLHTSPAIGGPRSFTKVIPNVVAGQNNNPPGWSYTQPIVPDLSTGASGVRVPLDISCAAKPLDHETGVWAENNRESVRMYLQKTY